MPTNPTGPVFIPEEREAKLPLWAREQLQSYRSTITGLTEELALLKGELPGSNVQVLGKPGRGPLPLPKYSVVAFDNKWGRILAAHETNGRIRIQGDNTLIVRMNAGNCLTVELEDY